MRTNITSSRKFLYMVLMFLAIPSFSPLNDNIIVCSALIVDSSKINDYNNHPKLSSNVYDTIQNGNIAVIPNFLSNDAVSKLRLDAQEMWQQGHFSTDALAGYGSTGKFDVTKDRAVVKLPQWKNDNLGNANTRHEFEAQMYQVRQALAYNLNRPKMVQGDAVTKYGIGSTEISYTRFGPGAFLKRHVDEHHEELKGIDGWSKPTRRSISWLIYLNEPDWNTNKHGGQLRCFERIASNKGRGSIGAQPNGDLQIAWLQPTVLDPIERPVYLDARQHDHAHCAMYIITDAGQRSYITKDFEPQPILYMAGAEQVTKKLLISSEAIASRFQYLEPPKSKLMDILKQDDKYRGLGTLPQNKFEMVNDVEPLGGTLVLFDSVSLPHEVLATSGRERWATSGWFHEDQQPVQM